MNTLEIIVKVFSPKEQGGIFLAENVNIIIWSWNVNFQEQLVKKYLWNSHVNAEPGGCELT